MNCALVRVPSADMKSCLERFLKEAHLGLMVLVADPPRSPPEYLGQCCYDLSQSTDVDAVPFPTVQLLK